MLMLMLMMMMNKNNIKTTNKILISLNVEITRVFYEKIKETKNNQIDGLN